MSSKATDGIDAHWRAKHGDTMAYEEAWPLISAGTYKPPVSQRWQDVQHALDQADRGELIDQEEMDRRVAQMLAGRPL